MSKSSLSWLAITLIIAGAAIAGGHPALGTITGIAILLLGVGTAVGALSARGQAKDYIVERKAGSQKISNTLVTLSSAAILTIYAAGYHRTGAAANRFEVQTARRSTAAPIAAAVVAPTTAAHKTEAIPTVPRTLTSSIRKDNPRPSSTTIQEAAPAPLPAEQSPEPPAAPAAAPTAADTPTEPAAQPVVAVQQKYKDGTYLGWGSCRHGDIQASVVIQNGQIVSTAIATCATRYSCSWIEKLPGQVVDRQSPKVDYVSGATQSSDAFSDAIAAALATASE